MDHADVEHATLNGLIERITTSPGDEALSQSIASMPHVDQRTMPRSSDPGELALSGFAS